ncbi:MAG TPA: superoxide dismutase family protein [Sphingomonas sp.]|nr:superoxide dismutase family protein [Sphingomonas sp.]
MDGAAPAAASAVATLQTAGGANVGRAVATEENGGIRIMLDARALPPGQHGVHVHTTGRCDGPGFETAGPHWNPTSMSHGTQNPAGPHAGDLPNLNVAADGSGTMSMMLPAGSLDAMLDADGAAFVVHAAADDLRTDPSGNSGGRIACGVFARS